MMGFSSEDGRSMFLRNVGSSIQDHTAFLPRRDQHPHLLGENLKPQSDGHFKEGSKCTFSYMFEPLDTTPLFIKSVM
jgi:hypothetical protein